MTEPEELPPDYYCPNPTVDCSGKGADLEEVREPILAEDGSELGTLITMACQKCGYHWANKN